VRYEHLVQVNDLQRPDIRPISRSQLWRGLLLRAARPELFDPSIDATRVLEESEQHVLRELCRGPSTSTERVRLIPEETIEFTAEAGTPLAGSMLTLRIEEPAPSALFVRFAYDLRGPGVPEDDAERRALRHAYYYSGIDTVRQIRAFTDTMADQVGAVSATPPTPHSRPTR
jgi:hypothetical protein